MLHGWPVIGTSSLIADADALERAAVASPRPM